MSKTRALDALSDAERSELMASLEESEQDIDEGRTYNGAELRQAVRSWLGRNLLGRSRNDLEELPVNILTVTAEAS